MRAQVLLDFIGAIQHDERYREARRDFHENYEWVQGYWIQHPKLGSMESFCRALGGYYWSLGGLRELTWQLASQGCVGNSEKDFDPSQEIIKATMYLLHRAEIGDEREVPRCTEMDCIKTRDGLEICDAEQRADTWGNRSAFEAIMHIVRQVRNNLFHGRKLELERRQYERNKQLVILAERITSMLLEHLVEAEQHSGY